MDKEKIKNRMDELMNKFIKIPEPQDQRSLIYSEVLMKEYDRLKELLKYSL